MTKMQRRRDQLIRFIREKENEADKLTYHLGIAMTQPGVWSERLMREITDARASAIEARQELSQLKCRVRRSG